MIRAGALAASAAAATIALPAVPVHARPAQGGRPPEVRFATFNASLNRATEGALIADLSTPGDTQARTVAEIIQRARPDVLLINEFDFDAQGRAAALFQDNYLSRGQNGAAPVHYGYRYTAPSNTGIASGHDLNNDGAAVTTPGSDAYGQDSYGYGFFPGQYGMAVYSRYPIDQRNLRTFQKFLWKDMPGAALPPGYYSQEEQKVLRLSSKSHWDIPVKVGRGTVHFLTSHPTPPTFDGTEDRNGRRNHDEIRLWADYVRPSHARYIYDDRGRRGGLEPGARFVIAGDQNADPHDGDSFGNAIDQLLGNPRIDTRLTPSSPGATEASALQGGANTTHQGDPKYDTADFADGAPGNLRADYVLPSKGLKPARTATFWPVSTDPLSRLTGTFPFPSSDHRLVWLDVRP
jgi:hypothetical protein